MYYLIVFLLMLALPALSIAVELSTCGATTAGAVLAKWYVFWAVGVRLTLAGIRQIAQPQYTAEVILGLKSSEVRLVVRELGFANLALGLAGLLSLAIPGGRLVAALAGGVFYGLAAINHALQPHRNRLERVAMLSDFFAAAILAVCIWALLT
jgi:hypothetical protein